MNRKRSCTTVKCPPRPHSTLRRFLVFASSSPQRSFAAHKHPNHPPSPTHAYSKKPNIPASCATFSASQDAHPTCLTRTHPSKTQSFSWQRRPNTSVFHLVAALASFPVLPPLSFQKSFPLVSSPHKMADNLATQMSNASLK